MKRIILHWTAGRYTPNAGDLTHYHFLIDGDGRVHNAVPVSRNAAPKKAGYAAHTLNCNTDSIGVAICAMFGAVQYPFNPGKYPLKENQWKQAALLIQRLCKEYKIQVSPKTVLTHAEVSANLGILQRGKWDIAILPFARHFDTPREVGDALRYAIRSKFA